MTRSPVIEAGDLVAVIGRHRGRGIIAGGLSARDRRLDAVGGRIVRLPPTGLSGLFALTPSCRTWTRTASLDVNVAATGPPRT
jgi:hypothetical protein